MAPTGNTQSSRSKRKLSQTPGNNSTPLGKQQTISQLFTSSEQKRSRESASLEFSPNSKRRKLRPIKDQATPLAPLQRVACIESMYSFPSSRSACSGGVIDLTKSPTGPRPRRVSGGGRMDNITPCTGTKKLIVKNLRTTPRSDPGQYCNRIADQVDYALTSIFNNERLSLSNEELYRGVENVCKLGKAAHLAQRLFQQCNEHITGQVRQALVSGAGESDVDVLRSVLVTWSTWNKQLSTIRSIFFYLDRSHLLQTSSPSIYDTAVSQFRTHIFGDPLLRTKIIDGTCDLLLADRKGSSQNHSLFRDAVKMFHELAVYTTDFEPRMLHLSQDYISKWADRECSERVLADYVEECLDFVETEMKRCELFEFDATTRRALLTLLEHHLIERKEADLTDPDSVADLLDIDAIDSIEHLFSLLQRRRLGSKLKEPFSKWIQDTGTAIIFDEKGEDQMVMRLLALKLKLDNTWRVAFHKHEGLGHVLRESFETFINKSKKTSATWNTDNSKPGEMVAKYVDGLLRGGVKAIPTSLTGSALKPAERDDEADDDGAVDEDSEVKHQLDQVLDLFRFVHGKAVFEAFYKKDLARRLLMGRSASDDAEKSMLTRLKNECGAGFTQNLEQMFKDTELSKEELGQYKKRMQENDQKPAIDLSVNILSAAAWPSYPDIPVIIPQEIKKIIDTFEAHYYMKHSGRKLQWKHALAHCQLTANFPKGKKEIVVSSFQAIVMLLFNGKDKDESLSYERIKAESGLSEAEVKRTLQSLACAKLRPLTKHPKGRDVNEDDTFTVNLGFSHEKYRVKINAIQLKETKEENQETHERVAADRQYETQAAIVRIMKSRKTMNHSELIAEVISATKTRGTLSVGDIKKNIDRLIEKEYMERAEGVNAYNYLA